MSNRNMIWLISIVIGLVTLIGIGSLFFSTDDLSILVSKVKYQQDNSHVEEEYNIQSELSIEEIEGWVSASSSYKDVNDDTEKKQEDSSEEKRMSKTTLSAKEFAEIYAEFSESEFTVMSVNEFSGKYGSSHHGDESIQVVTYDDRYNNDNQKAYRVRNAPPEDKEEFLELTEFIHNK